MSQWTASVSAAHLARLLQPGPAPGGNGRKLPAYRGLADGVRLLVLEGRVQVAARLPAERELITQRLKEIKEPVTQDYIGSKDQMIDLARASQIRQREF